MELDESKIFTSRHIIYKISLSNLLKKYTYLDGTPCGIKCEE